MEERQRRQQHVTLADVQAACGSDAPPEELRLRAANALGRPRCARGVEDGERVAGPDGMGGDPGRRLRHGNRRAAPHGSQPGADNPDRIDPGAGFHNAVKGLRQVRFHDQQAGGAIVQDMLKLSAARGGIDGHHDRADPGAAEKDFEDSSLLEQKIATRSPAWTPAEARSAPARPALPRVSR